MRNDTEYMYASARIRAAEGKDTAGMRLERMLEARTPEMLLRTVLESGFLAEGRKAPVTLTEALDLALADAVNLVKTNVPEPELYDFLLVKYDCNNCKVALKSAILGPDRRELYYTCGTFSPEGLADRLKEGDTAALPRHMAEAVREAQNAYALTGEGRVIDFILDRACFADMSAIAEDTGVPLFREYAQARADITNILSSVRLADRGTKEGSLPILEQAFVPGGTMDLSDLVGEGCLGYEKILERMKPGGLKDAVEQILAEGQNTRPEKIFDNCLYRLMNRERYVPFGVHVPAAFLVNREAEIRNCRIIDAGLRSGLTGNALRERIRGEYV